MSTQSKYSYYVEPRTLEVSDRPRKFIEAFAAVAKNRADLGAIATMGEYVYRPLKAKAKALAEAQ